MERSLRVVPAPGAVDEEVDVDEPVSLGDAAKDALSPSGEELELSGEQQALIPACRVKFEGMSWDSLDSVPDLKQKVKFVVEATIVGHTQKVMADGELREYANAKVTSVTPAE